MSHVTRRKDTMPSSYVSMYVANIDMSMYVANIDTDEKGIVSFLHVT